jgi:imidazolonepropionase-like amidohydrolase
MAQKGVSLVPTLVLLSQWFEWSGEDGYYGNVYIPGGGDDLPTDKESLRSIHWERLSQNLLAARDAGVRIGLGSDSFCTDLTPFGEQSLNELHAMVRSGLTEMEALVAATKNSAEILRIERETGTVTVGKSADFIVLKGNPLDDITRVVEPEMLAIVKEGSFVKNALG